MEGVTHNGSPHQGSTVTCHGCERNENRDTNRAWSLGWGLHCTTCHGDGHRACETCGACLPTGHRWDRFYCSSTCRVRAKQRRERWEAEHPEEAAERKAKLDEIGAAIRAMANPEHIEHRKRIAELRARAERCAECERPFAEGEVIYRRARRGGPVLPYCAEHRCGQSDGYHNADADEGYHYPACRCPGDGDRKWLKPEPCAGCGRLVANDRETASPWKFVRDWQRWDEERPLTARTFCSEGCRRTFRAKARPRPTREPRQCASCHREFTARADARYCTAACRQKAYRRRKAAA